MAYTIREDIAKEFLSYIAEVMEMGAKKHGDGNWMQPSGKKSSRKEMCDSLFHHLAQTFAGNLIDDESGLDHRQHAACRNLMSLYIDKHNIRSNND